MFALRWWVAVHRVAHRQTSAPLPRRQDLVLPSTRLPELDLVPGVGSSATRHSRGVPTVGVVTETVHHSTLDQAALNQALSALDNAVNLRDVGGLACYDGGATRHRVLLRSGTLRLLTEGDAQALTEVFDVRTVVDLRTARELAVDGPSALARAGIATLHLPLIREDRLALPEADGDDDTTSALHHTYQAYLDLRGHHIATTARLIADSPGTTLVHCAAGKDRTGVTVAVLLDAVGVERTAVLADYVATNNRIEHIVATLGAMYGYQREIDGVDVSAHLAQPAALTAVLDRLDDEYAGAAGWLRSHGLDDATLTALRRRLIRPTAGGLGGL